MSRPQANTFYYDSGLHAEFPVRFRFPVTGLSISATLDSIRADAPPPAGDPPVAIRPVATPDSTAQWEMVIPKMVRPATRPAPERLRPAPRPPQTEHAPSFSILPRSSWAIAWNAIALQWKLTLAAVATIGLIMWAWPRTEAPKLVSPAPEGGWVRERAFGAGLKEGRQLIRYRTSPKVSDYRLEFEWNPDSKGVGWIFRASDAGNYHGARLGLVPSRVNPSVAVEHFTVLSGIESQHSRKLAPLVGDYSSIGVRMDARGSAFTVYVQGNGVDSWTDPRLADGDIGFYLERNESPSVQAVQLSFFNPSVPGYKGGFKTLLRSLPLLESLH
jgi:hypothetical protein